MLILFGIVPAQDPKPTASPPRIAATEDLDKFDFQEAAKLRSPSDREAAFMAFAEKYPESELVSQAREYITAARAEMAAKAIESGDNEEGVRLFRLAVRETPEPVSEKLFTGILIQIPNNLFFRDLREESFELASMIEKKVAGDAKKLLGIATFYLAVENASDSRRLAEKAIDLDATFPAAYQTLGLAHRLGFDLEASETAYTKALELDPESNVSRRSLAEIKRALGKPGEAIGLYDAIIASDPSDANAGSGRTLALFDAGRTEEAESSLETLLSVNPRNMVLLVGTAYWYAANGEPQKAIEYANRALGAEPRYTWSYITLARGLIASARPLEAERVLLSALRYGYFPTLDYQIAAARLDAGFYREAAEALGNSFSIVDGKVKTRLGGRVERTSENFVDLLSPERQAAIFQPLTADDPANAERLKRLLRFSVTLEAGSSPDTVAAAADLFVEGSDPMRTHRLMFAATRLLENEVALEKASELVRRAVGNVDESLEVETAAAAVLADELYASRRLALSQGSAVVVPDVPKQTLARILRSRIEELDGWAAFKRGDREDGLVHLKRAASIVPPDSAFSRSVHWKLGTVLESMGRDSEALDNYVMSYKAGAANDAEKAVIRAVFERVNGSLDGFEQRLSGDQPRTETASLFLKEPAKTNAQPSVVREQPKSENPVAPAASSEGLSLNEATTDETDPVPEHVDETGDQDSLGDPAPSVASEETPDRTEPAPARLPEDVERANREAMMALDLDSPLVRAGDEGSAADEEKAVDGPVPTVDEAAEQPSRENSGNSTSGSEDDARGATRPRMVTTTPDLASGDAVECTVVLSQESASVILGGSTGILVGLEGARGVFKLRAISDSPQDLSVAVDRSLEAVPGQAMFLISSISARTGVFSVTFETSCGRKELQVTVR